MVCDIYPGEIDMTHNTWSVNKDTVGVNGMFLKTRRIVNGEQLFFKLPSYDSVHGFYGIESVMEILAQRVAKLQDIPIVEQRLVKVKLNHDGAIHTTYAVCSKDYRMPGERRVSMRQYCALMGYWDEITNKLLESSFGGTLRKIMLLDYIIYNCDRHDANLEILYNTDTGAYRLVNAFDNGYSLIAPIVLTWKEKDSSYYLVDASVNNYLGSIFLLSNLKDYCVGHIRMKNVQLSYDIMSGINNIIGNDMSDFLFGMLKTRYENAMYILNA